jgi:hypothetical protein
MDCIDAYKILIVCVVVLGCILMVLGSRYSDLKRENKLLEFNISWKTDRITELMVLVDQLKRDNGAR